MEWLLPSCLWTPPREPLGDSQINVDGTLRSWLPAVGISTLVDSKSKSFLHPWMSL